MTAQKKALALFGLRHQLCKLAEECAELAAAALRLSNAPGSPERLEQFCEEVADVEIMIEPMRDHFGAVRVDAFRASKLKRLEKVVLLESNVKAETASPEPAVQEPQGAEPKPVAAEPKPRARKAAPRTKEAPPDVADKDEDSISIKDAALLVGKSEQTIRNALDAGKLGCSKGKGRTIVSRKDVLALWTPTKGLPKQPA